MFRPPPCARTVALLHRLVGLSRPYASAPSAATQNYSKLVYTKTLQWTRVVQQPPWRRARCMSSLSTKGEGAFVGTSEGTDGGAAEAAPTVGSELIDLSNLGGGAAQVVVVQPTTKRRCVSILRVCTPCTLCICSSRTSTALILFPMRNMREREREREKMGLETLDIPANAVLSLPSPPS